MSRPLICLSLFAPAALFVCVGLLIAGGASGAGSRIGAGQQTFIVNSQQTFTVNVDGANKSANESFIAYYPRVMRVHAGDTVVFHEVGNGEPHTVT